jgi:hypothetical protein
VSNKFYAQGGIIALTNNKTDCLFNFYGGSIHYILEIEDNLLKMVEINAN